MKIIAGLGNPGEKYSNTRHNIGFILTSFLAEKHNISGKTDKKFNSIIGKGFIGNQEILIVQPLTFMNLSGESISKIAGYYKVEPEDILVCYDDISLDLGTLRYRKEGSAGGHNGIKSIIKHFSGDDKFPRLKIGIGPQPAFLKSETFVLQKFSKPEQELIKKLMPVCAESVENFLTNGIEDTQNKFNGVKVE